MSSFLLTRIPYEEPHLLRLVVQASNGTQTGELEIYTNPEALIQCADGLSEFPRHPTDAFLWELGSERPEDRWTFYFRFAVFLTSRTGACAIHVRLNNNQDLPAKNISEFCLSAEPGQVNRLGKLFREFAALKDEVLSWRVVDGELVARRIAPAA